MILQDHMIKGSCGVMGSSSSYHPAKFGGQRQSGSRDLMVFRLSLDLRRPRDQNL